MLQIYTPKQWYSLFNCPSLMIDDNGLIWAADEYYKILFSSPSGKIDYAAGKIYGKDLGGGLFSEPIGYLETKNGVTRIMDAKQGYFSTPILYIQGNKIYTAEEYGSIFGAPSGYVQGNPPSSGGYGGYSGGSSGGSYGGGGYSGGSSGSSGSSSSGGSGGGLLGSVLTVVMLLLLPGLLFNITTVSLVLAVIYLLFAVVSVIRHGADFSAKNLIKGLGYGFATLVVVYLVLFVITTFVSGYNRDVMNELAGRNELAGWIAGFGTFVAVFEKNQK